jgi:hypothetical protein
MVEFPGEARNFLRSPDSLRGQHSFLFIEYQGVQRSKNKVDYFRLVPSLTTNAATMPLANMH